MTQSHNAYLHDLGEHLTVRIVAHQRRQIVAECDCGWRSPLSKKPDAAARLWSQLHLKALEAEVDAGRCSNCRKPWPGNELCPDCRLLTTIFDR